LRAARNTGAAPEEISEVMLHVAVYAGVPAANHALATMKRIYEGSAE
jgi:alkylhydroperoxidase/carboxymuconolactone decarboxylase family protein YurZ